MAPSTDVDYLQSQIERLTQAQEEMSAHVRNLERNYHDVLVEMVGFQRNMAQQDGLMQNLIQYFLQSSRSQVNGNPSPASSSSMPPPPVLSPGSSDSNPFLPQRETLRMVHPDAASASLQQMNEMSRLSSVGYDWNTGGPLSSDGSNGRPPSRIWAAAANAGLINPDGTPRAGSSSSSMPSSSMGAPGSGIGEIKSRVEALQRIEELQRMRMGMASAMGINIPPPPPFPSQPESQQSDIDDEEEMVMPTVTNNTTSSPESLTSPSQASPPQQQQFASSSSSAVASTNSGFQWPDEGMHEGLQVYTVGHLLPKDSSWGFEQGWDEGPSTSTPPGSANVTSPPPQMQSAPSSSSQKLRVRRSTYVPGWAVPPRVLLVDDDAVSRKLSSKFLQVFGCAIDVAVDGVGAVNKMNLEKYDLVLMVRIFCLLHFHFSHLS